LSAMGWERGRRHAQQAVRAALVPALVICLAVTLARLIQAERRIGQTDVDVQANEWILKNVPRGARVAVHDEANAYLPRTVEQLRSCVAYVDTAAAYGEKWLTEGVPTTVEREQPMQSVVLNDERFYAYWCRRELDAQQDSGFYVVPYHEVARFGAVLERDAIRDFRDGSRESTGGIDVLVLNRPVDVGLPPRQIFRSDRGQRAIYARVGGLW